MDATLLSSPTAWIVSTLVAFVCFAYWHATKDFKYFSDQGIPGPKPVPFIGNMWNLWNKNLTTYDAGLIKKYGKVMGYFDGPRPNLWIADDQLIKSIFVKDFDHFVDRRAFEVKTRGVRKWLTSLHGQEWKDVRSSVTPAFTSGKIKRMSVLIKECVDRLSDRVETLVQKEGKLDAKETFSAFTMDVIARCAFGLTIETLGEKDDPFVANAKHIFHAPANKTPLILLPNMYPNLFKLLLDKIFVTSHLKFFLNLLDGLISERSKSNQKYNDFIEVATEAILDIKQEGTSKPMWTREQVDEIVMGQSSLFMIAGFDTTAMTMTNAFYLLAKHPEIQEKLFEEVSKKLEDFDDVVSHEMVAEVPYVEQVINEVLRIYPPAVRIDRECTREISYDKVKIKKGMLVTVPIYALHHLEEYWPEPEKFDPERWSPENKSKRNPYAYMPFGMGPRNCVGMRFAVEELKLAICDLVRKFRFFPVAETPEELEFDTGMQFVLQPTHSIVGVELRQK